MRTFYFTLFFVCAFANNSNAQSKLKPGFDAKEYLSLFSLFYFGSSIPDSNLRKTVADPFKRLYRSPEVGLKNQWSLYLSNENAAVISIRGTIGDKVSWLANFYAAMIPAIGSLHMNDSTQFNYKLSADSMATVHVGWTVSMASMAPDIVQKIKELRAKDVTDFYIFGHSQGGAIAFLLRSYLHYLQQDGNLPGDIRFKTYCSAAPKPGNMYYAYDYENITRDGWGFTIVNRKDWVPESPYTIQRIQDMNIPNPLINTKKLLKKEKFGVRLIGGILFGRVNRKPQKAQKMYTKYLGKTIYKLAIKDALPGFKQPEYVASNNYMRAGSPIVLMPDEAYQQRFKEDGKDQFVHHHFAPYYYLIQKHYPQ
ncbi:lipase family protein [Niabella insulamsoli]|uniref:lipase family protein n=1 Tax=Niabella insulamsoli TaxID=3144874 RepID=UPI0031FD31C9